jgi:hypothetical protein
VPGGAEGGVGLGGALLGLAQLRDSFGQRGQLDEQHDRGEGAVVGEVGVGGDDPGGVAELVPGRGRDWYPSPGLAGGTIEFVGGAAQGPAVQRGGGCVQRVGGGARGVGGSGRVPGGGVDAWVREQIEAAPPLTSEQRRALALLLNSPNSVPARPPGTAVTDQAP